jgi:hypothetical protein
LVVINGYEIKSRANLAGADLSRANLAGANLSRANLSKANLYGADLSGANLYGANLSGANLYGANLYRADLYGADLYGANLYRADLYRADLYRANLYGADLSGANLAGANLAGAIGLDTLRITPDGAFLAYKKLASGEIAIVNVPFEALRVNAYGSRKIRVSKLCVEQVEGKNLNGGERTGTHHPGVLYEPGAVLTCDDFDPDPRVECSRGLYVFLTRGEAQSW